MAATTRREQRDRTRTHLLETTVACLVELGYAGTSTQRIQERAKVSRGALLHHFPSKAELLAAAVEYVARLQLEEIRAAAPDTAQDRLASVRAAMSGPAFQAALELWMASRTDPALREALLPSQREIGHAVQSLLAPDFASRSPSEARVSLESLLMLLRGLALTSTLRDDPALADAILARWSSSV